MKRHLLGLFAIVLTSASAFAADENNNARQLADDIWKASGGDNWSKVKEVRFTFNVEQDGKSLAKAEHDWNIAAQTDHVKWKDKDVTVNLAEPPQDGDGKAAYARWVNDSYWLLAPLKVKDPGVKLRTEGKKEVDGGSFDTLRLSFDKIGLTPNDNYLLYVDPQSKLVRAWDYMPQADVIMHGSWEKYEKFGGLNLATEHNFGGKMIRFTGVEVVTN